MTIWCRYCVRIQDHDRRYRRRRATHALGSDFPRCDFHWRFRCECCGGPKIFHAVAFCPRSNRVFCVDCAPEERVVRRRFWAWPYYYSLKCPWQREWHAALDRLEYERRHPWQARPEWRRRKRWMSRSGEIPDRWSTRTGSMDRVSEAAVRKGWDEVAGWWVRRYTDRGDTNREWVIDPVLLRWIGDVRGLRILDAGCGAGYLSRILARRAGTVVGVDVSPKLIAEARASEAREPLGIRFIVGNLANLIDLDDGSFDLVVSNVVLLDVRRMPKAVREVYRVLRPGGRFVFSITHPAFEVPPGRWVRVPRDTERPEERAFFAVDRYLDRVAVYWAPRGEPEVVSFHRPLRDFSMALYDAGFVVIRLEEPTPRPEALRRHYRQFADQLRVPNFLIVEARKPFEASLPSLVQAVVP